MEVDTPTAFAELWDPPLGALRYRVYYGGRGSAKSWQFARRLLIAGIEQPLRVLCAREFQSSIRESVHHLLVEQIGMLDLWPYYTVTQNEIIGPGSTQFIFKGVKRDPDGFRSTEGIDLCWIEEAHAVSAKSWQVLIPTIRKPNSEIWVSFNPGEANDPTYKMFIGTAPPRSIVRKVGYKDNPWLPDVLREEAETLRLSDPAAYAHVWGGEPWSRSDTQIMADKCITEEFEPGEDWDGPYFGADWGFANDPTILVKLWRYSDRLYVEHEVSGVGWDNAHIDRQFRTIPGAASHVIRGDNARPETINELRKLGLNVVAAPKGPGSVEDGIAHLRGYLQIVIHPRCARAQQEARLYRYATNKAGDVLPKIVDAFNHFWDATRYGLSPLIRSRQQPRVIVHG